MSDVYSQQPAAAAADNDVDDGDCGFVVVSEVLMSPLCFSLLESVCNLSTSSPSSHALPDLRCPASDLAVTYIVTSRSAVSHVSSSRRTLT